jgi:redox-sensitive bicupin YhaK (pirin superfamily)
MEDEMSSKTASAFAIQRSGERAFFDFGWLQTYHSFSFADYFDPKNLNWGALRVFNDDVVQPGKGFGTHPHRDMEILTYVFEGELEHKDSMGNVGVIRPGAVQYLSAGTGITHSEYNHSAVHPVHLVQMWVLPRAQGLKPQYGQVDYTLDERRNRWLPIASGEPGVSSKIAIWQDASAYVARIENTALHFSLRAGRLAYLFAGPGEIVANGEALRQGDAVRIAGPLELEISGNGEAVLWDVPPVGSAPEDA